MKPIFMIRYFIALLIMLSFFSCKDSRPKSEVHLKASILHEININLEKTIIEDYFSPPVASRVYLYPNIAAYECLRDGNSKYKSLSNFYPKLLIPKSTLTDNQKTIAAVFAFYAVGKDLVYSSQIIDAGQVEFIKSIKDSIAENDFNQAKNYGLKVADAIIKWSKTDGYKEMRSASKYEPSKEPNKWIPTPPDYNDALEPHWGTLRPMTLKTSDQFKPAAPAPFSLKKNSLFYKELMEVYNAVIDLKDDQPAIAKFWDCNPIVPKHQGHITFSEKKLTPGGHWLNIGRNVMKNQNITSIHEVSKNYVLLTAGIYDAFISCWEEKYSSNYIRPVTVIQKHIDPDWMPILLTPNFPEYPSGHSVVSGSASAVLTQIFGDDFAFTDTAEVPFGMKARSFTSFYQASSEAAISRMYGGIHFRSAIDNGITQGKQVGIHVMETLKLTD